MAIDLLLELDDHLYAIIVEDAAVAGMTVEEFVRKTLMEHAGWRYEPRSFVDDNMVRPHMHLDLRTG